MKTHTHTHTPINEFFNEFQTECLVPTPLLCLWAVDSCSKEPAAPAREQAEALRGTLLTAANRLFDRASLAKPRLAPLLALRAPIVCKVAVQSLCGYKAFGTLEHRRDELTCVMAADRRAN